MDSSQSCGLYRLCRPTWLYHFLGSCRPFGKSARRPPAFVLLTQWDHKSKYSTYQPERPQGQKLGVGRRTWGPSSPLIIKELPQQLIAPLRNNHNLRLLSKCQDSRQSKRCRALCPLTQDEVISWPLVEGLAGQKRWTWKQYKLQVPIFKPGFGRVL